MKKKLLISIVLALALLTLTATAASAEFIVMLGSFTAGSEIDAPIAWVGLETEIQVEGLPEGLRVEREEGAGDCLLHLRGTARTAGDVSFLIHAEEDIACTLTLEPAAPRVSTPRDVQCRIGDLVDMSITASVPDAGTLRYQWYYAAGSVNALLEGATGNVLRADTSTPGTIWYCCEVTNVNNGYSSSVMSEYIGVQVKEREAQSISVESLPRKTDYRLGELLDTAGLRITVRYENGYNEIIDGGFSVSPSLFDKIGTQKITVGFAGKSCSFDVTVRPPTESVTGIGVLTLPNKVDYVAGEYLESEGLTVRAYTVDGSFFDVYEDLECSPIRFDRAGEQTVTVRYAGRTCSFTVHVKEEKVVTGISVVKAPDKLNYIVGDRLDTTGLSIQLNTNRGSELLLEGYTVTPKVLASPGKQTVTVIYGQYQAKFTVTVDTRDSVTPTPKPTPTPAAGTAESSPEPSPSPEAAATPSPTPPMRRNTGVNTAVKIIFAVAVLALAGLAGYVWYLRRQGYDPDEPVEHEPVHTVSGEPMDDDKKE